MALAIVRGPAGAGKSGYIEKERRPGDLLIDYTAIYVALSGVTRGPDGKYPIREGHDPLLGIVSAIKLYAIAEASRRELGGFVTTSSSAPGEIERLRRLGADGEVVTLDPGEQIVRARLADDDGELSEQCRLALARWY